MPRRETPSRWVRWLLLINLGLVSVGAGGVYRGCVADAALDNTQRRLLQQRHRVTPGQIVLHPFTAKPHAVYRLAVVQESPAPFTGAAALVPVGLDPQRQWTPQALAKTWPGVRLVWREFKTSQGAQYPDAATAVGASPHDTPQPMTAWYAQTDGAGEVEIMLDESSLTPQARKALEDRRLWNLLGGALVLLFCALLGLWTLALWSEAV